MLLRLSTVDPLVSQVVDLTTMAWVDPEFPPGEVWDLPDELAEQVVAADGVFWAAQTALGAYLRAERRDRESYKHVAEIERRRLQRGRARPYRRARPNTDSVTESESEVS